MNASSSTGRSHDLVVLVGSKRFDGNYRVANGVLRVFYKLSSVSAPIDEKQTSAEAMASALMRKMVEGGAPPHRYDYSLSVRSSY